MLKNKLNEYITLHNIVLIVCVISALIITFAFFSGLNDSKKEVVEFKKFVAENNCKKLSHREVGGFLELGYLCQDGTNYYKQIDKEMIWLLEGLDQ